MPRAFITATFAEFLDDFIKGIVQNFSTFIFAILRADESSEPLIFNGKSTITRIDFEARLYGMETDCCVSVQGRCGSGELGSELKVSCVLLLKE